jgi:hypothetical protein
MKQGSPIYARAGSYFDIVVGPLREQLGGVLESDAGALVLLEGDLLLLSDGLGHMVSIK